MPEAFLTHAATELPGPPVPNGEIERYLGRIRDDRQRLRDRVLANNQIVTRHYAIDPETGQPNATLAQMQAAAVRKLLSESGLTLSDMDLLICSTAVPEHITPGLASMVHGELGSPPVEIATAAGVCAASITALKLGHLAVASGDSKTVVVGGAERTSGHLRASHFRAELTARAEDEDDPHIALGAEFLRWMLSDAASCVLLRDAPAPGRLSLRVEWVQSVSFAGELPTCMYMGGERLEDGSLKSWRDEEDLNEAVRKGYFNLRQDIGLLQKHIISTTATRAIAEIRKKRPFTSEMVDWVLPHYSSGMFEKPAYDAFRQAGFNTPLDRWRSNLRTRGNIGAASMFTMIDDLLASGDVRPGDGVLAVVPESGRFHTGYAFLRAVEA